MIFCLARSNRGCVDGGGGVSGSSSGDGVVVLVAVKSPSRWTKRRERVLNVWARPSLLTVSSSSKAGGVLMGWRMAGIRCCAQYVLLHFHFSVSW